MEEALWANRARRERSAAIPTLSRILASSVRDEDFVGPTLRHVLRQAPTLAAIDERHFRASERDDAVAFVCQVPALGSSEASLLFFGRSSVIGGLRVPRTPPAETLLELLYWDGDDVYVFDPAGHLRVHVESSDHTGEMLLLVETPKDLTRRCS